MKSLRSSIDLLEVAQPEIWDNYRDSDDAIDLLKFVKEVDWSMYPNLDISKLTQILEHLPHKIKNNSIATASLLKIIDRCTIKDY